MKTPFYVIAEQHSRKCLISVCLILIFISLAIGAIMLGWIFPAAILWLLALASVIGAIHHSIEAGRNIQLSSFYDDYVPYREFEK